MATLKNCAECGYVPIRPERSLRGLSLQALVDQINQQKNENDHSYVDWLSNFSSYCTDALCDYKYKEKVVHWQYTFEDKYRFSANMETLVRDLCAVNKSEFMLVDPKPHFINCPRCYDEVYCTRGEKGYEWLCLISRKEDNWDRDPVEEYSFDTDEDEDNEIRHYDEEEDCREHETCKILRVMYEEIYNSFKNCNIDDEW